jgi:hypothetical protein
MGLPHFYLVIMLISGSDFSPTFLNIKETIVYHNSIEIDAPTVNLDDIDLSNIVHENVIALAVPIYDSGFEKKLKELEISFNDEGLNELPPIDDDFEIESDYYNEDIDNGFSAVEYYMSEDHNILLDATPYSEEEPLELTPP